MNKVYEIVGIKSTFSDEGEFTITGQNTDDEYDLIEFELIDPDYQIGDYISVQINKCSKPEE